jgi:hypothetical protein
VGLDGLGCLDGLDGLGWAVAGLGFLGLAFAPEQSMRHVWGLRPGP